jgi:uncharacterized membrane protein
VSGTPRAPSLLLGIGLGGFGDGIGLLLAGWGAFNVVEGLVDHMTLGIHHVRDDIGGPLGWTSGSWRSARC